MANGPLGDIEILFRSTVQPKTRVEAIEDRSPSMRLRFSRQTRSLEVARYVSGPRGEEWIKKIMTSTADPPYVSHEEWKQLEDLEKNAIDHLARFVQLCVVSEDPIEAMEKVDNSTAKHYDMTGAHITGRTQDLEGQKTSNNTMTTSLSSVGFYPRPPRLSTTAGRLAPPEDSDGDIAQESLRQEIEFSTKSSRHGVDLNSCEDDDELGSNGDIKTRFIPSVGWCIRYGSRVSQGGRYRMMFLDGVALDIDVDEDWVEFRGRTGETAV